MTAVIIGIDASRLSGAISTGTERYSREVIKALLRCAPQHEYRLYTREPLTLSTLLTDGGCDSAQHFDRVTVVHIRQQRLWTHIGLAREIALRPPDAFFIPAHVLPLSQAIRRTTRSVVTIHDVGYRHFPQAHPLRQRLLLEWGTALSARYASAVVVDSEATRRDVQRFYRTRTERIAVAYPGPIPPVEVSGLDAHNVMVKYGLSDSCPYVLFIGTQQPRKNLARLIQAWRLLDDGLLHSAPTVDGARPQLIVAGSKGWGGEDLPRLAAALGLGDSVRFIGYISDMEKAALLRGARVFAFPSLYEGFGFPVLEAQSAGVPVVCSNTSALPEVAGDGAILIDPFDVQAMAGALRDCLFDASIRKRLIQAGRQNVTRFNWDRCAGVVMGLLEGD
ncbi:MAG: glycosyltransferase family 4 protein [Chloroflexi bacterium]|nr:glycosyltransferase family 4 protein [Chloroflexota bacterium]MCL5275416.1 glycosyltransferase family 4 protein [Chloroflexota bacterium]